MTTGNLVPETTLITINSAAFIYSFIYLTIYSLNTYDIEEVWVRSLSVSSDREQSMEVILVVVGKPLRDFQ